MYAQMLVGMVAFTGMWWLEERTPERGDVAAHLVNLGWNGLAHLEAEPRPLRAPGGVTGARPWRRSRRPSPPCTT